MRNAAVAGRQRSEGFDDEHDFVGIALYRLNTNSIDAVVVFLSSGMFWSTLIG